VPAQQTAPAHGSHYHFEAGHVFEQFDGAGGLPGNDAVVVEGVHEGRPGAGHHLPQRVFAGLEGGFAQDDFGPVARHGLLFDFGRRARHHDVSLGAHLAGGVGNGLGVVARRVRCHPVAQPLDGQRQHRVHAAPDFKGADLLEIFAFEKHPGPRQGVEAGGSEHRRAVNERPDPFVRLPDRLQRGH
jgi:hypothetical protein